MKLILGPDDLQPEYRGLPARELTAKHFDLEVECAINLIREATFKPSPSAMEDVDEYIIRPEPLEGVELRRFAIHSRRHIGLLNAIVVLHVRVFGDNGLKVAAKPILDSIRKMLNFYEPQLEDLNENCTEGGT